MDPNGFKILKALPYKIHHVCGLCRHGWFPTGDVGTCDLQTHENTAASKWSDGRVKLTIHRFGSCPQFTRVTRSLGEFDRLRESTDTRSRI